MRVAFSPFFSLIKKTCLIDFWKITGEGEMAHTNRKKKQKHDFQVALQVKDVRFCLTRPKEETEYETHVN